MHHPSRFSSVCQHRHWLSVHLLALTVTSLLMACGPAASTRATHPATIVLYASNANHYASFDSPNFRDTVTALRTSDGSLLWRFQPAGVVSTTDKYALTMVDDIVYITTNRGGSTITGTVYALHAADGSLLWHYELKDETQLVSIADGIVYLTTQTLAGPDNAGELSALRASDGTLLWHKHISQYNPNVTDILVDHGIVYTSTEPGSVSALRASDGSLVWHTSLGAQRFVQMSLVDGTVYVVGATDAGNSWIPSITLYALQASDGHVLWHSQSNLLFFTGVSNGTVFTLSFTDTDASIHAIRSKDGSVIWQRQASTFPFPSFPSSLVAQGDVLYAIRITQGPVTALRTSDGSTLWTYQPQEMDQGAPTVALLADNERAYISSSFILNGFSGSYLEVRKASDGTVLWQYPYQRLSSIFELVDGTVYVGATTGFYAGDRHGGSVCGLQATTGTKRWCHQADTGVAPLTVA